MAIQILETKTVAESAGNELGYGALARRLRDTYGVGMAVGILNDVQLTHDASTPTSVPHGRALHSSDARRYDFIDFTPADTASRIAEIPASVEFANDAVQKGEAAVRSASRSLGLPQFGSNAWAVAPSRSTTGHAMLWGAPQVSYYVPQVVDEIEIVGGPNHARGMSVPGAGPAVVIGYTPHHAWSLTSSQDDQADTYIDHVRQLADGTFEYLWNGAWRPVQQRTETITTRVAVPPQDPAPPPPIYTSKQVTFYRTLHGPREALLPCVVEHIDARAGLSFCKVRSFWGAEIETGLAVVEMGRAASVADADAAARRSVSGFNFIYADRDGHIAYWHTGRLPIRVRGHDPRLPAPGDGSFDWRGYLDPRLWPTVTDPAQGFVVSWNNKPQANWPDSGDGVLWGATQRVGQPRFLLQGSSRLSPDDMWHVARRSGELDLRDTLGFARFITALARRGDLSPVARAAVAQVARWDGTAFYPGGAERDASGKETGKVKHAGFVVMTAWMHALLRRAGQRVFQPVTHNADTAAGVRAFTRTPGTTSPEFEFFDDYEAFLYDMLAGRTKSGATWFGRGTAEDVSKAALDDAVSGLSAAQGNDPSKWRADMPRIDFMATDVASIPPIPWENRGTWGQIVAFR
jgi:penicillin amidase